MYTYACTPEKRQLVNIYMHLQHQILMRWSPNLTPKKILNGVNNIKLYELCSQYRASIVILICRCLR